MIDLLYSLIYILPFSFLSAYALLPGFFKDEQPNTQLSSAVVILVTVCLFAILKIVDNKKRIIILGSLSALIVGFILVTEKITREQWFSENPWANWALLISVGVMILVEAILRFRVIKPFMALIFALLLICSYRFNILTNKASLVSAGFVILAVLLEGVRFHLRGDREIKKYVIRTIPFLILGMIVLLNLPFRDTPYDWALTKKAISSISTGITKLMQSFDSHDSTDDMVSTIGFSEEAGEIGGNIKGDPKEMMKITPDFDSPQYIYLDGKYFDDFDGRKWNESGATYPYILDTLEACCATELVESSQYFDFCRPTKIRIEYSNQNTTYLFAPIKSLICDSFVSEAKPVFSGKELVFDKKRGKSTKYCTEYISLNRNDKFLPLLIETGEKIDQKTWEQECQHHDVIGEEYSYDAFLKYRQSLYNFNSDPHPVSRENLSEGVRDFLDTALSDAKTDYEKLLALEEAFSGFEYTTSPGRLPSDISTPDDFLDYFILDSQKGFCNSYATAFVLLCRAEGIPARYVHGYRIPGVKKEITPVTSTMAHAYPEAYIKGIGWMIFEPTPVYSVGQTWDKKDIAESTAQWYNPYADINKTENDKNENISDEETEFEISWYTIAVPVALSLLVLSILIFIERLLNIRRFSNLSANDKARTVNIRILNMLKHRGLIKSDDETVNEFALRAYREQKIELTSFASSFEKILYSTYVISEAELESLYSEYNFIRDTLSIPDKIIYWFTPLMK